MTMFLPQKQVGNKKSQSLRATNEMLAIGIAIRQATRIKKIIDILHKFGLSVEYNRLLRLEEQLATTVLQRMQINDDLYLPPDTVIGRQFSSQLTILIC